MCLACEQQEYFFRIWCADFLARGEMPPGVTEADLDALGLPKPAASAAKPVQHPSTSGFRCDSPGE